jgi:uncharacterized protein (TIGR00297 family)
MAARRLRSLTRSVAVAAVLIGAATASAGWSWAALLVAFFVTASALSKLGEQEKTARIRSIVEKSDERDVSQVLANGGVFAFAGIAHLMWNSPGWYALGAGALAASAADTWATEIGTLAKGNPVSIISGRAVPVGTSGGVTLTGSAAAVVGSLFIAAGAAFARWPVSVTAVALGGVAGALADSLLGATLQSRRYCDACSQPTERKVHSCGIRTRPAGGVAWLDNDGVNAICSAVGGLITLIVR